MGEQPSAISSSAGDEARTGRARTTILRGIRLAAGVGGARHWLADGWELVPSGACGDVVWVHAVRFADPPERAGPPAHGIPPQ
eukprot:gene37474-35798_t